jgi:hypothetical protein
MPSVANKLQLTPALRAAERHKKAQNARRPHVRDTLAEIERMWNRLAVEAEVSESMLTRFLASGHNDPTAQTLAQTIVTLAKQDERDPVRLEQRAIEILSGQSPDLALRAALGYA